MKYVMRIYAAHEWNFSPSEAIVIQRELAPQVSRVNSIHSPRFVAGSDLSRPDAQGIAQGAVVVLSYPELVVVDALVLKQKVEFPYIPGLLSFREAPLVLAICEKLTITPDLLLVDGQGIAHPRRLGLASHLGLFLDIPTIGCAKSRLWGTHQPPGSSPGSFAELRDHDETIGAVLRTKSGTNPIYVSIGHKVDMDNAIKWVMNCCRGYRLPEPTRLAHLAAGGHLKQTEKMPRQERFRGW